MILIVCFYVSAKFVQGTYSKEPEFYNNEVNYGMNYFLSYALFVFMEAIFFSFLGHFKYPIYLFLSVRRKDEFILAGNLAGKIR